MYWIIILCPMNNHKIIYWLKNAKLVNLPCLFGWILNLSPWLYTKGRKSSSSVITMWNLQDKGYRTVHEGCAIFHEQNVHVRYADSGLFLKAPHVGFLGISFFVHPGSISGPFVSFLHGTDFKKWKFRKKRCWLT